MHIDLWTLLLQACNLVVLLLLLRWLFYRPLLAVIEARRQAVQQTLAEAQASRDQAQAELSALAQQRQAADSAAQATLQTAREQAEQDSAARLEAARVAVRQCLQEAQAQIERERLQAGTALYQASATLATELAQRLLSLTPVPDEAFWPALLAQLQATPAAQLAQWLATGDSAPTLTVASAHPLPQPVQQRLTFDLQGVLSPSGDGVDAAAPTWAFEPDPALLCGLELRFAHGVLGLNWAAELSAAQAALQQLAARPALEQGA